MEHLIDSLRWVHVIAGFTGLAAFWVPIFARKGGARHVLFGRIFKYCAYVVLLGALLSISLHLAQGVAEGHGPRNAASSFAFLVFLAYLAWVTFVGLRHGIAVLQHKKDLTVMNTPLNRVIAWSANFSSVGLIAYALVFSPPNNILLFALSPIGLATGIGILKAIKGKRPEGKAWFYEHMGAMMGTGIAFHTAFAVFGSGQLFNLGLSGFVAVIPWILPALIGIPAINLWTRHYKRRFGDLAT